MTKLDIKNKIFSKRLRKVMNENDQTIYDIADILDLSSSTISKYINNKITPKITTIKILSQEFNINPVWLMGYDVEKYFKNNSIILNDEEACLIRKYRKLSNEKKQYVQGVIQSTLDNELSSDIKKNTAQ